MTIALIILFIAFTLVMFWQSISPFLKGSQDQLRFDVLDGELKQVEELTARKQLVLDNLREIANDRELDKLSPEDYQELKRRYEREGIRIMRELDALHGGRGWEARVDAALASLTKPALEAEPKPAPAKNTKKKKKKKAAPKPVDSNEQDATSDADTIECPECDKVLERDARFCSQCGENLTDLQISAAE